MSSRMQDCIQSVVLQCGGRRISLTGVDLVQSRATSGPPPSCMRLTVILHPSTDNKQLEAGGAARRGVGRSECSADKELRGTISEEARDSARIDQVDRQQPALTHQTRHALISRAHSWPGQLAAHQLSYDLRRVELANSVWCAFKIGDIKEMEKNQKRATKLVM